MLQFGDFYKRNNDMLEGVELPQGLNPEILEHLINPQNYGKLEDASCVGIALDEKTNEYVIMYLKLKNDLIEDVRFATNGCQDTVVVGSMFTQMIKSNNIEYAYNAIKKLNEKLGGDKMSKQQQICADMVLSSFIAAMKNFENLVNGKKEDAHILKMKESCETQGNKDE
jgi:nitrogen fixation NifU-like protein